MRKGYRKQQSTPISSNVKVGKASQDEVKLRKSP